MKKLSVSIRRPSLKRYRARMGHIVHVFLMRQVQKIVGQVIVLRGKQSFVKAELSQDEIDKIEEILAGVDFYGWAVLAGDIDGVMEEIVQDGGYEALKLLGLDVTADRSIFNVVNERAVEYANTRSADLVTMVSDSTREMMRGDISEALTEGWSNQVLASKLSDNYAFSADRAMTIARTETIRASNQGTLSGFQASGVVPQKEWTTAEDDLVSEDCEANGDQGPIGIDEAFDSGDDAPPAHPNAVMAGGTFAAYGELEEIVRADYHGPAILLTTAQGRTLTIGPNHPVLTGRRGMVKARFLAKGDELVYDRRCHESTLPSHTDFEQMPFIEDGFETLLTLGNLPRVATAAHDLHGDRTFCHGEVEVIEPANRLLPVLDSCGVEKLCKRELVRSDMQPVLASGDSASDLAFDAVDLSASSGMSSRLPSHFEYLRIRSIHYVQWKGKVFDATTSTGIYNYAGFVVKNCRCVLVGLTELETAQPIPEEQAA